MTLIQYDGLPPIGDLYQIELIRKDRADELAGQSVLQANKWATRRAIAYKVSLDFRNKLKKNAQRLRTTFATVIYPQYVPLLV